MIPTLALQNDATEKVWIVIRFSHMEMVNKIQKEPPPTRMLWSSCAQDNTKAICEGNRFVFWIKSLFESSGVSRGRLEGCHPLPIPKMSSIINYLRLCLFSLTDKNNIQQVMRISKCTPLPPGNIFLATSLVWVMRTIQLFDVYSLLPHLKI